MPIHLEGISSRVQAEPSLQAAADWAKFHPQEEAFANIGRVSRQVDLLIVVDGSGDAEGEIDTSSVRRRPGCEFVGMSSRINMGLAATLNRDIREALDGDTTWALTLDQDTAQSDVRVTRLLEHADDPEKPGIHPAILGRETLSSSRDPDLHRLPGGLCLTTVPQIGSTVRRGLLHRCDRVRVLSSPARVQTDMSPSARGWISPTRSATEHGVDSFGGTSRSRIMRRSGTTTVWRNRLACTWEYLLRRPRAAFRDVRWLFNYTARALLYSGHAWAITRAVFAGTRDFLLGRFARMPQ